MANRCLGNSIDKPHPTDEEQHSHKCPRCDVTWWHLEGYRSGALDATPEDYESLHKCPKCGTREGWIVEHLSGYLSSNPTVRAELPPTESERRLDDALGEVAAILLLSSLIDTLEGKRPGDTLAEVVDGRAISTMEDAAQRQQRRMRRGRR